MSDESREDKAPTPEPKNAEPMPVSPAAAASPVPEFSSKPSPSELPPQLPSEPPIPPTPPAPPELESFSPPPPDAEPIQIHYEEEEDFDETSSEEYSIPAPESLEAHTPELSSTAPEPETETVAVPPPGAAPVAGPPPVAPGPPPAAGLNAGAPSTPNSRSKSAAENEQVEKPKLPKTDLGRDVQETIHKQMQDLQELVAELNRMLMKSPAGEMLNKGWDEYKDYIGTVHSKVGEIAKKGANCLLGNNESNELSEMAKNLGEIRDNLRKQAANNLGANERIEMGPVEQPSAAANLYAQFENVEINIPVAQPAGAPEPAPQEDLGPQHRS